MGAEDDLRKHLLVPVLPLTGEGASSRGSAPHLMSIEDYEQTHHTKSIIRKMDVDTMPETTHLGCSTNTIASAPKMAPTGALTMAQFDEAFSAKHLAMKAAQAQAKAPTAAKTKTAVSPGLTELATKSSEYVVKLHTRCQALGIGLPHFDYTGTSSGGWSGKVSLPTVDVDELQDITVDDASFPLPSKGQVKEALSKQAFAALEQAIEQDKVHKAPKKNKGARAAGAQASMDLHDRVQKLALAQPVWEYDGSTNMGFTATAKFQGLDVEDLQAITNGQKYPSKILAKHATAPLVMEALKKAELDGKLGNGSVKVRVEPETAGVKIPGPNYSGQLLEFQRSTSSPQPTYRDFQSGTRFAALVSVEGFAQDFGDINTLHISKKAARQDAACHAIQFFKDQGTWPDNFTDAGGIKKKIKLYETPLESLDSLLTHPNDAAEGKGGKDGQGTKGKESSAQRLMYLSHIMALGTPEYVYTQAPLDPDFYTVTCRFQNKDGEYGEARHVLGKKKAKGECARLTVMWLEEEYERRMSMVRGAVGGAGKDRAEENGKGKAVVKEGDEHSDSFEDAVEEMEM